MRRACLQAVHELARTDPRVVFIGSDLGPGTLDAMRGEMPERFFMEGIAEQNVIGMAAGMAMEGFVPFVNTIATFITRRCFEQVALDLCLHNLPVRLIGNGGGSVYAPLGPTHMAIEDMAILRALPNMTVVAPADADEMRRLVAASRDWSGPLYIRLAKGGDPIVTREADGFAIGRAIPLCEPGEVLIVATGIMTGRALQAAETLAGEGVACGVLHVHTLKPLDAAALVERATGVRLIVTVEEHVRTGGLGAAVLEALADGAQAPLPPVRRLSLPDAFPDEYGNQDSFLATHGLTAEGIAAAVRSSLDDT